MNNYVGSERGQYRPQTSARYGSQPPRMQKTPQKLSPQEQMQAKMKSQAVLRTALKNPLVVIIGVVYALLSVSMIVDIIRYLFIGSVLGGSVGVILLGILVSMIFVATPIVKSAAFFTLNSNAKGNPRRPMKENGSAILVVSAVMQTFCWLVAIAVFSVVLFLLVMQLSNMGFVDFLVVVAMVCFPIFWAVYSICFIGFAETIRKNTVTPNLTSKFTVITAVMHIVFAVGAAVVYALYNASLLIKYTEVSVLDMSLLNSYSIPLMILVNILIAVYCFNFRSTINSAIQAEIPKNTRNRNY